MCRSCSRTSLENMSEGQTDLDSDDSIPAYKKARPTGKYQRLSSAPQVLLSSDDRFHQPLSSRRKRCDHKKEKASRDKERAMEAEISDEEEKRRALGLDVRP